jgi:hypothetical protein
MNVLLTFLKITNNMDNSTIDKHINAIPQIDEFVAEINIYEKKLQKKFTNIFPFIIYTARIIFINYHFDLIKNDKKHKIPLENYRKFIKNYDGKSSQLFFDQRNVVFLMYLIEQNIITFIDYNKFILKYINKIMIEKDNNVKREKVYNYFNFLSCYI